MQLVQIKKLPIHCIMSFSQERKMFEIDDEIFQIFVASETKGEALEIYNDIFERDFNFYKDNYEKISKKEQMILLGMKAYLQSNDGYLSKSRG